MKKREKKMDKENKQKTTPKACGVGGTQQNRRHAHIKRRSKQRSGAAGKHRAPNWEWREGGESKSEKRKKKTNEKVSKLRERERAREEQSGGGAKESGGGASHNI